jgi:(p)ppGpp synthase/HD superfamily hydrolase
MATLQKALEIAVDAHKNQYDKGGCLYVLHPIRMSLKAETNDEQITAMLHDVVEDCVDWTLDKLQNEGFSDTIINAIDRLTRRSNETYFEFIERCCGSIISIKVKLLDIADNMDITRLPTMEEKDLARMKRYHKARLRLTKALMEWNLKNNEL